jgi:S-adenosylmethionine uptake transporter
MAPPAPSRVTAGARADVLKAALWMTAACVFGTAMLGCIRMAARDVHPFEIAFFRAFFALLLILPWVRIRTGRWLPATSRRGTHVFRATVTVGAMLLFFWAVLLMPLGDAVALSLTGPLFATAGAALFLREVVGWRRWGAILVGLAGALLVIQPAGGGIGPGAALVLASAVFGAGDWLALKRLATAEPTPTVVLWLTLLMTPLALLPALFVWTAPSLEALLWLAALAVAGTLTQISATRAFAFGELWYLAALSFLHVVTTAGLGALFFGESLDAWTLAGGAVIVGAVAYITQREARRKAESLV